MELRAGPPPPSDTLASERWRDAASWAINSARLPALPGAVSLTVLASIPEVRRDLTEITGALIGLLVDRRMIADAGSVTDTLARWDRTISAGTVRLVARQTRAPSERIGVTTREKVAAAARRRFAAGAASP